MKWRRCSAISFTASACDRVATRAILKAVVRYVGSRERLFPIPVRPASTENRRSALISHTGYSSDCRRPFGDTRMPKVPAVKRPLDHIR